MIVSLTSALTRVTLFWYLIGLIGAMFWPKDWLAHRYELLTQYANVPHIALDGFWSFLTVPLNLLIYWTLPILVIWGVSMALGLAICELKFQSLVRSRKKAFKPTGQFGGVKVAPFSMGALPKATVPVPIKKPVKLLCDGERLKGVSEKDVVVVRIQGQTSLAVSWLNNEQRKLCEDLIGVLLQKPDHYAGAGHGVGLLEHTLNVVKEAAEKCSEQFTWPLVAALAHDIGKLITFKPDGKGGWTRVGLHSRESARILASLDAFHDLPINDQRALLLAVKYDHAPSKMPVLAGDTGPSMQAMRIISALSKADQIATAAEKDRTLERIQPEDILWQDFVNNLRNAPIAQMGKKGQANQLNWPSNSDYLYIYEVAWREEAIRRLPEEVAAALDLNRRDSGKMAKYTQILTQRLEKEGLLVTEHPGPDGVMMRTPENIKLWDIKSGTSGMRGIIVVRAEPLWKKLNYRISPASPWPVTIEGPNANPAGKVTPTHVKQSEAEQSTPTNTSDELKIDLSDAKSSEALGLDAKGGAPRSRRNAFKTASPLVDDTHSYLYKPSAQDSTIATTGEPTTPAVPSEQATEPTDIENAGVAPELSEEELMRMEMESAMSGNELDSVIDELPAEPESATSNPLLDGMLAHIQALSKEAGVSDQPMTSQAAAESAQVPENDLTKEPVNDEPATDSTPMQDQPGEGGLVDVVAQADAATDSVDQARDAFAVADTHPTSSQAPARVEGTIDAPIEAPSVPSPGPTLETEPAPALKSPKPQALANSSGKRFSSRTQENYGIAVADEEALALYPHLSLGEEYYLPDSPMVKSGHAQAGQAFSRKKGASGNKPVTPSAKSAPTPTPAPRAESVPIPPAATEKLLDTSKAKTSTPSNVSPQEHKVRKPRRADGGIQEPAPKAHKSKSSYFDGAAPRNRKIS